MGGRPAHREFRYDRTPCGGHAVRHVPICPALRAILENAFEQAAGGSTLVAPQAARGSVNRRTTVEQFITRAGLVLSPNPKCSRTYASCETDGVEAYPGLAGDAQSDARGHEIEPSRFPQDIGRNRGRRSKMVSRFNFCEVLRDRATNCTSVQWAI